MATKRPVPGVATKPAQPAPVEPIVPSDPAVAPPDASDSGPKRSVRQPWQGSTPRGQRFTLRLPPTNN